MKTNALAILIAVFSLTAPPFCQSIRAEKEAEHRLAFLESVQRDDLHAVSSVVVSSDGRFLYASAYQAPGHVVFSRDEKTGKLTHIQTVQDRARLFGATALRLSRDERFAVAAAFGSKAVSLYARDKESGTLSILDCKQQGVEEGISGLDFTVEAQFSPDGRFVYALDDGLRDKGGVTCFRLTGEDNATRLEFVEAFRDNDLGGARGMVHHPSGSYIFVASRRANALVAMRRDGRSGRLTIVDVSRDDADGVTGLHAAFGVTISCDGQYVYTVSGQHGDGKDNCVGVFAFDDETETLSCVQEVYPAEIALDENRQPFNGGNEIVLDSAQRKVYACATGSGGLAVFDRDPSTGTVELVQLIHDNELLGWVSGLAVSPDGRFVYAAAEKVNSIAIYSRNRMPLENQPVSEPGSITSTVAAAATQAIPPLLEFRFAAQPANSEFEPRVPEDFEKRHYPDNSATSRTTVPDKGFVWVPMAEQEVGKVSMPITVVRGDRRVALLADTPEHALPFNGKWSIEDCRVVVAPDRGDRFTVELKLDEAGGAALRALTKTHLNRPLAIVVKGELVANPVIRSEIGRTIVISGNFNRTQADTLAAVLRSKGLGK